MADTSRSTSAHSSRIASDGLDAALGIYLAVYSVAAACFAVGLYALLQPSRSHNPGIDAYNPPPGTVISYVAPTHTRSPPPPDTDGRSAAAAEPATTTGFADQTPRDAARDAAKEAGQSDVPAKTGDAKTDDTKPEVKTEGKPQHQAHRERRHRDWGYQPSLFGQHRPWF
jgi:hypothetical protein